MSLVSGETDVLHVFNANHIGGPEKATLPGLGMLGKRGLVCAALFLTERRLRPLRMDGIVAYARRFSVNVTSIEVSSRYDNTAIQRLHDTMMAHRTRLVHCHGNKATLYAVQAARNTNAKLISTQHGFITKGLVNRLYNLVYLIYARRLEAVLAVSESQARELISKLRRLGVSTPVTAVHNPVQAPGEEESGSQAAGLNAVLTQSSWWMGKPPPRPWSCQVARLAPEKDHETVLRAIARMESKTSFTHWIFGEGPEEKRLRSLTDSLGIGHRIIFCGHVPKVEQLLPEFDVLVTASVREALPMAVLEATVRGIPVISTDISGVREILPDDNMAFFVRSGRSADMQRGLARFLAEKDERIREMANRARKRTLDCFSLERWCENIEAVYGNLIR